jgi:U3 small nucleolar RNA-associated protein 22
MSLHPFLMSIPAIEFMHPLRAAESLLASPKIREQRQSSVPFSPVVTPYCSPYPSETTNWKVAFTPPTDITIVGSWATKTSVKGQDGATFGVDLALEMPGVRLSLVAVLDRAQISKQVIFQEKDYLNGRFFQKRAFYLAAVAAALSNSKELSDHISCLYLCPNHDLRTVILVLHPKSSESQVEIGCFYSSDCRSAGSPMDYSRSNAEIRLIPVLPSDSPIPAHRLSPAHTNFRVRQVSEGGPQLATPLYNTALLLASAPRRRLLAVHAATRAVPAFSDALALLRVWANQRGYGGGPHSAHCLVGFEQRGALWPALLELVVFGEKPIERTGRNKHKRKPLGKGLSSYQLFKAALDFIGATHASSLVHI